jgi:hydroxyethylthiazole kinase-like uncharacterized protein yjeF
VVDWKDVEEYIEEDDAILIGPGMVRADKSASDDDFSRVVRRSPVENSNSSQTGSLSGRPISSSSVDSTQEVTDDQFPRKMSFSALSRWGDGDETGKIVNFLLKKYPLKRWVLDGGALQEVDLELITESCILTPHRKEFDGLLKRSDLGVRQGRTLSDLSKQMKECTILLKGKIDIVCQGNRCTKISGGNPGMTKGGTGDVLAGLVAALYCKNDAWAAATMASYINKKAGDSLYKRVGPYFNAEDLVKEIPLTIYGIMREDVST